MNMSGDETLEAIGGVVIILLIIFVLSGLGFFFGFSSAKPIYFEKGYKKGQIDYANNKIQYEKIKDNGNINLWIKKCQKNSK